MINVSVWWEVLIKGDFVTSVQFFIKSYTAGLKRMHV